MGLDITAYRRLKPDRKRQRNGDFHLPLPTGLITEEEWTPAETDEVWSQVRITATELQWTEQHWPGRPGDLKPGLYAFTGRMDFRAGSYSGYGKWRDWLVRIAGWGNDAEACWNSFKKEGPFYELIEFADCEGVIGATVAAKLAKDFAEFDKVARQSDDYFYSLYQKWRRACDMAADSGAILFH